MARFASVRRICRLSSILFALVAPEVATADFLNTTGAELAPNFADISIADDGVEVVLEIDLGDYAAFAPAAPAAGPSMAPDLALLRMAPDLAFGVKADDAPLVPEIKSLAIAPRQAKPTAILPEGMLPPPTPPRSADVVRAVIDFPFRTRPSRLDLAPPLDGNGWAKVSIGFIARHGGVPISDYRYLSRLERLQLDWGDPWYSAFENPNLARHHRSALMSFVSVEPREVRHEIIFRLRDFESELDLGDGPPRKAVGAERVIASAERFFATRNPLVIDGEPALPKFAKAAVLDVTQSGIQIVDAPQVDDATALLGVILSYPRDHLPQEVSMRWDLFPQGVESVPVQLIDPAGAVPWQATPDAPEVTWTNVLKAWKDPVLRPVRDETRRSLAVPVVSLMLLAAVGGIVVRSFGSRPPWRATALMGLCLAGAVLALPDSVRLPLPGRTYDDAHVSDLARGLLQDAATAMLEVEPDRFDDALAAFVVPGRFRTSGPRCAAACR